MNNDIEARLEAMADHIVAVQNLLLSHIVSVEIILEGSASGTIEIAKSQRDSFLSKGRNRVAIRLNAMFDEIESVVKAAQE